MEKHPDNTPSIERWIGQTLRIGIVASGLFFVSGLTLHIAAGNLGISLERSTSLSAFISDMQNFTSVPSLESVSHVLLSVGILTLMATPFLRVLAAFGGFLAERDFGFMGVSLFVFGVLVVEIILSLP